MTRLPPLSETSQNAAKWKVATAQALQHQLDEPAAASRKANVLADLRAGFVQAWHELLSACRPGSRTDELRAGKEMPLRLHCPDS